MINKMRSNKTTTACDKYRHVYVNINACNYIYFVILIGLSKSAIVSTIFDSFSVVLDGFSVD